MADERRCCWEAASKILFGTDAPVMHPSIERCRTKRLCMPEGDRELMFCGNARKLLGV